MLRWLLVVFVWFAPSAVYLLAVTVEEGAPPVADARHVDDAQAREGAALHAHDVPPREGLPLNGVARARTLEEDDPQEADDTLQPEEGFERFATECDAPPPDPIEPGDSVLVVDVRDEEGGTAHGVELELWRIDAPGNEHWCAGDQRVSTREAEKGRIEWTGLAEGTYRLFSPDARIGCDDVSPFEVHGSRTVIETALALPRKVPVHVRILDEHGVSLTKAVLQRGVSCCAFSDPEPEWKQARRPRRFALTGAHSRSGHGHACGHSKERGEEVIAGPAGFVLDGRHECSRERSWSGGTSLQFAGRSSVWVHTSSDDVDYPHPMRFVAISVPLERIAACLRTEDGPLPPGAAPTIEAYGVAMQVDDADGKPDPRTLELHVRVTLEGYIPIEYRVSVAGLSGPAGDRILFRGAPTQPEEGQTDGR